MRGKHIRHRRLRQAFFILKIVIPVLLLLYPFVEPHFLTVEQGSLVLADLPDDIRQLRVVYVSDIHQDGFPWFSASQTGDMVSRINSLNADLVLLGGDYTSDPERTVDFFENMPLIHSNYGVFAVFGEHDCPITDKNFSSLRSTLNARGITLLNNNAQAIRIGQKNVWVAGVSYSSANRSALSNVSSAVQREDFVMLLCHTPEAIEDLFRARDAGGRDGWFDVAFFGHTHGNQLPLGLNLLRIAPEVSGAYRSGWIEQQRTPMLISRGVGTSGLPIRIGCSPQIHLITIRNR